MPPELIEGIETFLEYCNNQCYHEALCNVTPIEVSYDWRVDDMALREEAKQQTLQERCEHDYQWRESNKSKLVR